MLDKEADFGSSSKEKINQLQRKKGSGDVR
jgi:hypothetical protein